MSARRSMMYGEVQVRISLRDLLVMLDGPQMVYSPGCDICGVKGRNVIVVWQHNDLCTHVDQAVEIDNIRIEHSNTAARKRSDRGRDGDCSSARTRVAGKILVAPTRRLGLASLGFAFELMEDLEIKACRLCCGRQRV
jgi:hypothetical protein